jgi:RNA polymerase subunit RPABC4/transcription elongation factor Spt4
MGFLDDLGKSLNKVGKMTSEMASGAKLKLEITKNKSNIDKKYEELGSRIYFLNKEGMAPDESIATIIEEIDQLFVNIENLEKEIETINAQQEMKAQVEPVCRNCGQALKADSKFCAACGTKVEEEIIEEVQAASEKLCPNCQAVVGDAKFCNSCGTSLE